MAKNKSITPKKTPQHNSKKKSEVDFLISKIESSLSEAKSDDFPSSDSSELDNILKQRRHQRERLFSFTIFLSEMSFLLLVAILFNQSIVRIFKNPNYSLLDGNEFEILSVGIFGHIISVILIITKSLWDDKNYISFLGMDHLRKRN